MAEFFDAVFASFIGSGVWRQSLQISWLFALLVGAFVWGGAPEKFVVGTFIVASQASRYLGKVFTADMTASDKWSSVNEIAMGVDVLMLLGFVVLALQANRQYLIWIAAIQVVSTMSHAVRATTDELSIFVYVLIVTAAGWLQIFIMTAGLIAHLRRERGRYADWRWQVEGRVRGARVS